MAIFEGAGVALVTILIMSLDVMYLYSVWLKLICFVLKLMDVQKAKLVKLEPRLHHRKIKRLETARFQ